MLYAGLVYTKTKETDTCELSVSCFDITGFTVVGEVSDDLSSSVAFAIYDFGLKFCSVVSFMSNSSTSRNMPRISHVLQDSHAYGDKKHALFVLNTLTSFPNADRSALQFRDIGSTIYFRTFSYDV